MKYLFAAVLALAAVGYVVNVERRIAALETVEAGVMKTTWLSGGIQREVRSTQNPGESLADFQDRHFAAVRLKQADFPPDAP